MKKADNVLIICTDKRMIDIYRKVLSDMEIDMDIEYVGNRFGANINASLNYINEFKEHGKEIIVTRGYLAQEIRKNLDFKVIEISISAFDVLRALYKYTGTGVRLAAIECKAFLDVIMPVARLLNIRIVPYVVEKFSDFYDYFRQAKEDGADVICGGAMRYYDDYFRGIETEYASVDSSVESIRDSLLNAMQIYELVSEEKKKRELIETLVNVSDVGTIAGDSDGNIIAVNRKAAEIWNFDQRKAVGKKIENLNGAVSKEQLHAIETSTTGIYEIRGSKVLVDRLPISIGGSKAGYVLRMKKTDEILSDDSRVRSILVKRGLQARYTFDDIKGGSETIKRLKKQASHYARTDSTVLITGESGSGKELFAQSVHNASPRKDRPFLAINCSAFSPNLLESELFGYVSGAFTGARKEGKIGVFELAHTGTIFLDEIGDMDPGVQAKILRVIQEKEIMRVGDDKIISVDVRVIAATNKNLFEEVLKGNFREDLYYRLNVLNLSIPPLRERKKDIEELALSALEAVNRKLGCSITGIDKKVIEKLTGYQWHGNIRELNSFIEKMTAIVGSGRITMENAEDIFREMDVQSRVYKQFYLNKGFTTDKKAALTLKEAEAILIDSAMRQCDNNLTKAAEKLGIDRTTLARKIKRNSAEQN